MHFLKSFGKLINAFYGKVTSLKSFFKVKFICSAVVMTYGFL